MRSLWGHLPPVQAMGSILLSPLPVRCIHRQEGGASGRSQEGQEEGEGGSGRDQAWQPQAGSGHGAGSADSLPFPITRPAARSRGRWEEMSDLDTERVIKAIRSIDNDGCLFVIVSILLLSLLALWRIGDTLSAILEKLS